jgi:hypothetical protein
MAWETGVEDALKKAAERSDDGWLVTLVGPSHAWMSPLAVLTSTGNHGLEPGNYCFAQV